ncbi:MAG: hypothetical protein A2107_08755 [Verrucomicrobia bacterium GWF2_62_7]|nr:MAG: hypothetical protein A2107_08755 [Verrucomicrobia bacterium GWF2_62_7]
MSAPYPYPKLDEDGYDLEVVEQADAQNHPFLRHPIPDDNTRYAVKPGDIVKLIFRYRDHVEKNGQTFSAEHMWVRVTEAGDAFVVGRLDNTPQFTTILKSDDEIYFHPKHIVRFWSDDTSAA